MKRVVRKGVVGLSLLLVVFTAGAVVRSFVVGDMIEHFTCGAPNGLTLSRSRVRAVSGRGMVFLMVMDERFVARDRQELARNTPAFVFTPFWSHDRFPAGWPSPVIHAWLGCGYERYAIPNPTGWSTPRATGVRFPLWALLPVFGAPALASAVAGLRARRRRPGYCRRCGYDLRGSPAGCPECGAGRSGGEGGTEAASV